MPNAEIGRAVLVNGIVYERHADGSLVPHENKTDHARLDAMTDAEIETSAMSDKDGSPMSDDEWLHRVVNSPIKVPVGLKLDQDVVEWFRSNGRGYQTRINTILRRYMETNRKAG